VELLRSIGRIWCRLPPWAEYQLRSSAGLKRSQEEFRCVQAAVTTVGALGFRVGKRNWSLPAETPGMRKSIRLFLGLLLSTLVFARGLTVLTAKQMPEFSLDNSGELPGYWTVVNSLPDAMRQPESYSDSNPMQDTPTVGLESLDGLTQTWFPKQNGVTYASRRAIILYGQYANAKLAENGLLFLVCRTLTSTPAVNSNQPYQGTACRRVPAGDQGFWIAFPRGGHVTLFRCGSRIYSVDAPDQQTEEAIVSRLVSLGR